MTEESTIERLRRQKLQRDYPRRAVAVFSDDNRHNPKVLEDCPTCDGRGSVCDESDGLAALDTCPRCAGNGTTGEVVDYYQLGEDLERTATASHDGFLVCPGCHLRFTTRDPHRWTGQRHRTCGQRIRVEG